MCELFAMSSRWPAAVRVSLQAFAEHGGGSGPHKDGWGIAYYHGPYARVIKDTGAASDSDWVAFVEGRGLESIRIIGHVRYATRGAAALENTHPFARELGGRVHVFAHNGTLAGIEDDSRFAPGTYRPVGATDSERAFCNLLARLQPLWLEGAAVPALAARLERVARFAAELRGLGAANFLYADGETLFVHAHARQHEDGRFGPPGLNVLARRCEGPSDAVAGGGVTVRSPDQSVLLLASVPLTDESWQPLAEGELLALADGEVQARLTP